MTNRTLTLTFLNRRAISKASSFSAIFEFFWITFITHTALFFYRYYDGLKGSSGLVAIF